MKKQFDTLFLLESAKKWVIDAGELIKELLKEQMKIETKSNANDLVTNIDKNIENFIKNKIRKLSTEHRLLGEEGDFIDNLNGYVWILDPVDGTMNIVTTGKDFAVSLALYQDGIPVLGIIYDVMRDDLYHAISNHGAYKNNEVLTAYYKHTDAKNSIFICDYKEIISYPRLSDLIATSKGHRRYGSAALEIIEVASGRAGAFVHMRVWPWDIAAAKIIAEESGFICTRTDGTSINMIEKGSIIVANKELHEEIINKCFS